MPGFDAVMFDWSGTLVYDPAPAERVAWALTSLGRSADAPAVTELVRLLELTSHLPEVIEASRGYDTDAARHRTGKMLLFHRADLDRELAERLYECDAAPDNRPLFSDVLDVLQALRSAGVGIGVVSDIHLDIRPLLARHGADELIDSFVLSFEHGIEKPDPQLFRVAINELGSRPERTLMVGDTADRDGGAAQIGITTLILPRQPPHYRGPRLGDVALLVLPR